MAAAPPGLPKAGPFHQTRRGLHGELLPGISGAVVESVHAADHGANGALADIGAAVNHAIGRHDRQTAGRTHPGIGTFQASIQRQEIGPAGRAVQIVAVGDAVAVAAVVRHGTGHLLRERPDDLAGPGIAPLQIPAPYQPVGHEDLGALHVVVASRPPSTGFFHPPGSWP